MHMIFDVQLHFSARYAMSEIFLRFTIFLFRCHGKKAIFGKPEGNYVQLKNCFIHCIDPHLLSSTAKHQ